MINIKNKEDCCGCEACVQVCPKSCISFTEDAEGFSYPKVDLDKCIKCQLCEKVCPIINQYDEKRPLQIYAAKNINEQIRKNSSSGGIFTIIAEKIIIEGGVVFGARFNDNWEVIHDFSETLDGLSVFRGSKYVQSSIGNSFKQVSNFLKEGRKVLFSGTSCQIAGLHHFLRKEYKNLITVDILCHGVPSPKVWREYLNYNFTSENSDSDSTKLIEHINFRDKSIGWHHFSLLIKGKYNSNFSQFQFCESLNKNIFMKGFLRDLYLRPSCYNCPAKSLKHHSDITLGDFWGIQHIFPQLDDDKGISIVSINSPKGQLFYNTLEIDNIDASNAPLPKTMFHSVDYHPKRKKFFDEFLLNNSNINKLIQKYHHLTIIDRFIRIFKKKFFKK